MELYQYTPLLTILTGPLLWWALIYRRNRASKWISTSKTKLRQKWDDYEAEVIVLQGLYHRECSFNGLNEKWVPTIGQNYKKAGDLKTYLKVVLTLYWLTRKVPNPTDPKHIEGTKQIHQWAEDEHALWKKDKGID